MILVSFDKVIFSGAVSYFGGMPKWWTEHLGMLSMMTKSEALEYAMVRGWLAVAL